LARLKCSSCFGPKNSFFRKKILRQEHLGTTIGTSLDPQHPPFCFSSSALHFSRVDRCLVDWPEFLGASHASSISS
jgi:hypothetical protein